MNDAIAALGAVVPFDGVDADAWTGLDAGIRHVEVQVHDTLVSAGDPASELFVLLDGEVAVIAPGADDDAPVLATLGPGAIVGEIAVLTGGTRTASLVARSPVRAVAIDGAAFATLLERDPDLGRDLAATASQRLRVTRFTGQLQRLFPGPGGAILAEVADQATMLRLSAGDTLFHEGDPGDAAYVVVSGRLRVLVADDDGTWQEPIAEIGAGELVGEVALLDESPRNATIVAARDTTVARLGRDDLEALAIARPEGMLSVTRTIVARLRDSRELYRRAHSDHAAIGILPLSPGFNVRSFTARLAGRMGELANVAVVTSDEVDRDLGIDGIANARHGDPHELRLLRWLDEAEAGHDISLLQADAEVTPWTERCVERVDHVVLVAEASGAPDVTALESQLIAARELPHQRVSLVLLHPADVEHPRDTAAWLDVRDVDAHHHVRDGNVEDLDRLARHLTGRAVWLVLGGGGAKGFAHLGVIRALEEVGLPIDGVVGSSMGSTMAALCALGLRGEALQTATTDAFRKVLDYTVPISGMIAGERIAAAARRVAGDRDIEDAWLPLAIMSTNLTRSRPVVHRRGNLPHAIRASVAIPGVIPPVAMGDDLLVDGGVMNNLPVDVARKFAPTGTVIASDVAPKLGPRAKRDHGLSVKGGRILARRLTPGMKAPPVPRLVPTLMRSLLAAAAETRDRQVEAGIADLHLAFELRGVGLLEFDNVTPVAERGYEESIEQVRAFAEQCVGSAPAHT